MICVYSMKWEAFCVKSVANCNSSVVETDNLQLAVASGFLLVWYDNMLTESCWNAHSGVKWEEAWLYVPVLLYIVCLDSWLSPLLYISPIHCFLFPVFLCQGASSPPPLIFFHCLRRAAFPCFSAPVSLFFIWIPVTPVSDPPVSVFWVTFVPSTVCLKIMPPGLWHTDPCR